MKFSFNVIFQIIATTIQGANQVIDLLPPKWKQTVVLSVGVLQAVVALRAHFVNPDGTPASVAYQK